MTHHALLIEGSFEWAIAELPLEYQKEGADVIHVRSSRMGIDEARSLIAAAYQTPLSDEYRTFVLASDDITVEAQNALLKLLEEPPQTAQFYLIIGDAGKLLPTLRSRLISYKKAYKNERDETNDALTSFIHASPAERLAEIGNRATKKDDTWMHQCMNALEEYAEAHTHRELMHAIAELRPMFSMPGASRKMILEHLALLLP